jgi:diaminohydroxyphosphoribosylaminopyrimidine deaminase/5-amino-6-(5-phosphoribosylamino)uracil reductase
LSAQGITRLLVEGGAKVASSFLKAGLADEFWLFQGAKDIGGDGLPALEGQKLETVVASGWRTDETEMFGDDRLTVYRRAGSV